MSLHKCKQTTITFFPAHTWVENPGLHLKGCVSPMDFMGAFENDTVSYGVSESLAESTGLNFI